MSTEYTPVDTRRFTAGMTKDGRAKTRAPLVVPAFDERAVFVEIKTGRVHERAYVVFVGEPVNPEEALSRVEPSPPDRAAALIQMRSFIEQVAQFNLGTVLAVDRDVDGLPLLRKVAEHPAREVRAKLPG
jgi:hypothetical protein